MRYYMKQKISFFQDFTIKDENDQDVFKVKQKRLSIGRSFDVEDVETGNDLIEVKQKMLSFMPTMQIYLDGDHVASVSKKVTVFKSKYKVDELGWTVKGDIWSHNYTIEDENGNVVADINKKFFAWTDTFEFDINAEAANPALVIGVILAIDFVMDMEED